MDAVTCAWSAFHVLINIDGLVQDCSDSIAGLESTQYHV